MLTVVAHRFTDRTMLAVFRSPVVRTSDRLFQPVLDMVEHRCVSVEPSEWVPDPGYAYMGGWDLGMVHVFDQCPRGTEMTIPSSRKGFYLPPHVCKADPLGVFS